LGKGETSSSYPLLRIIFIDLTSPQMLGSIKVDEFVKTLQLASDVVLQNSIREGFGLSVTKAMWKEKAVIGGKVGGIKLQIENGKNGFLVSNPKEAAKRIVQLIKNPQLAKKLGKTAKETVREKFLIPRLLRDYLKLFKELI
jgi:trehalose synthase